MRDRKKPEPDKRAGQDDYWRDELAPPRVAHGVLGDRERRNVLVTFGMWSFALIAVVTIALLIWSEHQIDTMLAADGRLAKSDRGEQSVGTVNLGDNETVYFHTALIGAPIGRRLDLRCEWYAPGETLIAIVEYTTRRIDQSPWPTHCRHRFARDSVAGEWRVNLYMDERELSNHAFNVAPGSR